MRYVSLVLLVVFGVFTLLYLVEHLNPPPAPQPAPAANVANKTLIPIQLKTDFNIFRELILRHHPDPYRFVSEKELRAALDSVESKLNRPMKVLDFYRLLFPVLDKLGCSHTYLYLPQPLLDSLKQERIFYPGTFFVSNDSVKNPSYNCNDFEQLNYSYAGINGKPIGDVIDRMRPFLISEGNQPETENIQLTNRSAFSYYLAFGDTGLYGNGLNTEFYTFYYVPAGDSLLKKHCYAQSFGISSAIFPGNNRFEYDYYRIDSLQAAVLRLQTFDYLDATGQNHFNRFLESSFELLKMHAVKNLVLDLRGNYGGQTSLRDSLLSYLVDSVFPNSAVAYSKVNKFPFIKYAHFTPAADPKTINKFLATRYTAVNGRYELKKDSILPVKPHKNGFRGTIYILTDGITGSAAAEVAAFLQATGRAKIIGQHCNGYYDGNSSYYVSGVIFPESLFNIQIPLVRNSLLPRGYRGLKGPVKPDYPIIPTVAGFTGTDDQTFKKALELIKNGGK
jgi:hypothetical protein